MGPHSTRTPRLSEVWEGLYAPTPAIHPAPGRNPLPRRRPAALLPTPVKIATQFYLVAAAAVAAVLVDVTNHLLLWRRTRQATLAHHEQTERASRLVRASRLQFGALAGSLRHAPGAPDPDRLIPAALESFRLALREIEAVELSSHPGQRNATRARLARLEAGARKFTATWEHYHRLPAGDDAETFLRTHLLPGIEDDLLATLDEFEDHLAAEHTQAELEAANALQHEIFEMVVTSTVSLFVIVTGVFLAHRRFVRPLHRIASEVRAVSTGEHRNVGYTYTSNDELAAVARAVNDLIDRLRSAAFSRAELEKLVARRTADLRERELELSESRAQLQRAIAGSRLAVWEWTLPTDHIEFDGLCTAMLGYAPGEIEPTRQAWERLVHPEDRPLVTQASTAHLAGATPEYRAELRMRTRHGDWRWIRTAGRIVERDATGRPLRVSGTHADIDTEKTAQLQLQRRDEQLALALAASDSVLWDVDLATGTVSLDERWPLIVGGPPGPSTVTIRDLYRLVPAEERHATLQAFADVRDGRRDDYAIEHRVRHADGDWRWVRSRGRAVTRNPDGKATRLIGINADITALQQSAATAARQAELYAAINETALDLLAHRASADLLQALVHRASALLDAPFAAVALLEDSQLFTRAQHGPLPADDPGSPAGREAPLAWRAIDTRQPAIVGDYAALDNTREPYRRVGFRAAAVFPIIHADRVVGVLSLGRQRRDHPFTLDDIQKGQLLARLAALALHNASIYEDAVREAEAQTIALRENEQRFRAVFDNSPVIIGLLSLPAGEFVAVNHAGEKAFGYSFAEARGRTSVELGLWADPADREKYLGLLRAHGRIDGYEARMRRRDGSLFTVLYSGTLIVIGGQRYSLNILQDITDRKAAEAALALETSKLRAIFEQSPALISISTAHEGRLVQLNAAAQRILGFTVDEMLGRTTRELGLWTDLAQRARILAEVDTTGRADNHEVTLRRKDGGLVEISYSARRIEIEGAAHRLNILIDITARKLAERKLAESLREKEILLREIHHRVKNNLQIISGLLHFQAKKLGDAEAIEVFGAARGRLKSMILVHDKLYRSGNLADVNFADYMVSLVAELTSARDARGRLIPFDVSTVPLHLPIETALPAGMILAELLTNVVKYAFPGEHTGAATVRLAVADGRVQLAVEDDGAGFPAGFDPHTASSFGWKLITGLVAQLGGGFSLGAGPGARVTVTFPLPGHNGAGRHPSS
ncbi:MAG: hypothetical protein C0502_02310 [Opitutus sp.]|nr:hypothetical protein [Opitutus sp.]